MKTADKQTMIAIYNSLDHIATCFPDAHFRLYKENLITRNEFIDEVLRNLNHTMATMTGGELFLSVNEDLFLTEEQYKKIYSWLARTTVYMKNVTWYNSGVRSEADIIAMIDNVYVKSLEVYSNILNEEDKSAAQMVGIGIRNIVDFTGIRARNEANYVYQKECDRLEQGGYLEKGQ